ncbi:Ferrous iron transport protein B [hydrothermal vent metagenome]|uniref:Ferrous iron transport protein B n=1 Tax=hydrothermal vent metagenome TaxID=652676 RepID=A0A1W1EIE6_9ZZZZ
MNNIIVALAGQPNVGKSSLINAISNAKLKVGNFSGVTVDKTEINFKICDEVGCQDYDITVVDLPGAYSLNEYTIEEKVTKSFLLNDEYDLIINVLDSTNLQRNLLFTTQLLEMGKKVIVVLNMNDEAEKEGIIIDEKQLSTILGVPCIKTSASTKEGIDTLKKSIVEVYKKKESTAKVVYSNPIEEEINKLTKFFLNRGFKSKLPYRQLSVKLLQDDKETYKLIHDEPISVELIPLIKEAKEHIYIHANSQNLEEIFEDEHFAFAKGAKMEVISTKDMRAKNLTQKIDNLLINKFVGIPIFLFFMWTLFQLTFELGAIPMDYIDAFFIYLGEEAKIIFGNGEFGSLVADGMIAGVGAVIMFLPNILILFLGIALLETTGYMSRVAFLLDGFFHKFGLHGKSFIPLVTGFGCSVPAYMAARTLKNHKDRLLTLFIIGFMSCGARLPIYVLFVGAFFVKEDSGNILFLIYITGAILGLISAKILNIFVFKGGDEPFVMEMPKYRLPSFKLIWHTVYSQAKSYLKKAGTFILGASILIWFASNYPKNIEITNSYEAKISQESNETLKNQLSNNLDLKLLENSYLGKIGHFSEPIFTPLGMDWKMAVALETGLAAKEVVVSTLGVLYAIGGDVDENSNGLVAQIRANIPFASAVSFIVFVMIYLPCLAASMVFTKEAGSWKYLVYLFVFTSLTAWILSFMAYHITLLII